MIHQILCEWETLHSVVFIILHCFVWWFIYLFPTVSHLFPWPAILPQILFGLSSLSVSFIQSNSFSWFYLSRSYSSSVNVPTLFCLSAHLYFIIHKGKSHIRGLSHVSPRRHPAGSAESPYNKDQKWLHSSHYIQKHYSTIFSLLKQVLCVCAPVCRWTVQLMITTD